MKNILFASLTILGGIGSAQAQGTAPSPDLLRELRDTKAALQLVQAKCINSAEDANCLYPKIIKYQGLLCLAGERESCIYVRKSQSAGGQWFGSPSQFDRSAVQGIFAYSIATYDQSSFQNFIASIKKNHDHLYPSKAGDKNSKIGLAFWTEASDVAALLEIPETAHVSNLQFGLNEFFAPLQASLEPEQSLEETAERVYVENKIQERGGKIHTAKVNQHIANILVKRSPQNPFFQLLASNEATTDIGNAMLTQCAVASNPDANYCIFVIDAYLEKTTL